MFILEKWKYDTNVTQIWLVHFPICYPWITMSKCYRNVIDYDDWWWLSLNTVCHKSLTMMHQIMIKFLCNVICIPKMLSFIIEIEIWEFLLLSFWSFNCLSLVLNLFVSYANLVLFNNNKLFEAKTSFDLCRYHK